MNSKAVRIGVMLLVAVTGAYGENYMDPLGQPGSPEARMRTMNEILPAQPITRLPFSITNSGSYVVVGNLTGVSGANGISIYADNVTLDLNGFSLIGVSGSMYGIEIPSNQTSVVIRNGSIRSWGLYGLYGAGTDNSVFSGLASVTNGWGANCSGILIGKNNLVSDCVAANNKSLGISAGSGCTIRDSKAYGNGGRGISAVDGSTITGCSAYGNGGDGIATYNGSTITRCMAYQNLSDGIFGQNCTIRDCATYGNTQNGIDAEMCTVAGVSAAKNQGNGIYALGSVITQCSIYQNKGDGIRASYTLIDGNNCQANGYNGDGAGIRTVGDKSRVEGNLVLYNDRGIETSESGNFIVRNSSSGNSTNYVIVGTQTIGPAVIQSGTIASQNPWANFEF